MSKLFIDTNILIDLIMRRDGYLNVESLTKSDYANAISLKAKDFEDALQYECAKSSGCQTIITRNKKDYNFEGIEVLSPKEFLALS